MMAFTFISDIRKKEKNSKWSRNTHVNFLGNFNLLFFWLSEPLMTHKPILYEKSLKETSIYINWNGNGKPSEPCQETIRLADKPKYRQLGGWVWINDHFYKGESHWLFVWRFGHSSVLLRDDQGASQAISMVSIYSTLVMMMMRRRRLTGWYSD